MRNESMKNSKKLAVIAGAVSVCGAVAYVGKKIFNKQQIKQTEQEETAIPHKQGFYEKYIKRPQDFCCALSATIVLSPIMGITALLVRIKLGSPVIFKQERPGLNGEIFTLYKFRTMTDKKDENGELFPDEERLTHFGKMLRSTSLDELPELINMLKGDMSVVGPRPLLVKYLPLYNQHQARRHEVRPGFTGYAQVHGRNAITWETMLMNYYRHIDREKVQFDFLTHRDYDGDYGKEIKSLGGKIYHLPVLNPFSGSYKKALNSKRKTYSKCNKDMSYKIRRMED